jgi:hypothetical protein
LPYGPPVHRKVSALMRTSNSPGASCIGEVLTLRPHVRTAFAHKPNVQPVSYAAGRVKAKVGLRASRVARCST